MKKLLLLPLLILAINIASAALIINPSVLDISFRAGESANFTIEMRNTFDFKILDFEFTNTDAFTFEDIEIEPNQTVTLHGSVSGNTPNIETITSEVSFKYLVELPQETQTHYIEIGEVGFTPSFLVIRKGDTVTWNNMDEITRTVSSTIFDYDILPNQSASFLFNEVGEFTYQDFTLFSQGLVQVINQSADEKVNNPTFNRILTINLAINLDPTNITVENSQSNYTIKASESQEGLLEIKNVGNEMAQRVELTSDLDWINFDENNFDLQPGETNFVTYKVVPLILESINTDRDYEISIKIKASNSEEIVRNITVYVPFSEIGEDLQDVAQILKLLERFCESNANMIFCNNTVGTGSSNNTFGEGQVSLNLSEREVLAALREIGKINDRLTRTANDNQILRDLIEAEFPGFSAMLNESLQIGLDNKDKAESGSRVLWIVIMFLVIASCMGGLAWGLNKFWFKRDLMDGGARPRY